MTPEQKNPEQKNRSRTVGDAALTVGEEVAAFVPCAEDA